MDHMFQCGAATATISVQTLNSRVLFSREVTMQMGVGEAGLEKLMSFPGLCPLDPYTRSCRIKWAGTRTCWQGLVNHTCQKGPKTIPYYKLAPDKQYLQKILNLLSAMLHFLR